MSGRGPQKAKEELKKLSFRLAPASREVLFHVRACVIFDVCNQISYNFDVVFKSLIFLNLAKK
jgi:hypothetical protein